MTTQGLPLVLSLYRSILRVHRQKLPGPMREFGGAHVRAEFRSHLRGKTTQQQWEQFVRQWSDYVVLLRGDGDLKATPLNGSDLSPELVAAMNEDQRSRMEQLRVEAGKLGMAMLQQGEDRSPGG